MGKDILGERARCCKRCVSVHGSAAWRRATSSALVLRLDPGRKSLATIVCIDYKGKKHTWSISRGTYHTASGILRQNAMHAVRYSGIADRFASLTADGGALRASTSAEIVAYVAKYMTFEAEWWSDFALKRRESRSKFQRFVGKQKTLATFFGKVRKEAEALKGPGQTRIEVAYGAAGRTMAPTGRGELAVPTKGTFAFCARAFLGERPEDATSGNVVSFEDESNTSKKCWLTHGALYEKVVQYLRCRWKGVPASHVGPVRSVRSRCSHRHGGSQGGAEQGQSQAPKRRRRRRPVGSDHKS